MQVSHAGMMFNALNSHWDRKAGAALMVISAPACITLLKPVPRRSTPGSLAEGGRPNCSLYLEMPP